MDPKRRASNKQEKQVAQDVGGFTIAGSGNGWAVKNDVRNETWSIECKTTTKQQFTLTHRALATAETHALLDNREMAFIVEMVGRQWAVVSYENFLKLAQET